MKHIKRFFTGILILCIALVIINSQTRFFTDFDTNIPYLRENFPVFTQKVSEVSDKLNELLSHIPSPREIYSKITDKELPINPDDIAHNVYYASDTMLNFYPKCNYSIEIKEDRLDVYGISNKENDKYLVYRFTDKNGDVLKQIPGYSDNNGKFRQRLDIPDNAYEFSVFTGPERYGEYNSSVYEYIRLNKGENGWELASSPVYDNNIAKYESAKSIKRSLRNTYDICRKEPEIIALADEITKDATSDYDKAEAIHNWVAQNIYYDSDSIINGTNNAPYIASDVLKSKTAVCLGYSNLYAALCRSVGIPCNVVAGYAIGEATGVTAWDDSNINTSEANHAWNEVYVDNRWVIVDTTWDSKNNIKNGIKTTDTNISHLYFDSNLKFFSANHKITEYK